MTSKIKAAVFPNRLDNLTMTKEMGATLAILLAIAVAAPLIGNQFITGPIVNATLIVATVLLGMKYGILVGLVPSTIAMASGLLPPILAPQIPFIMVGNAILVITFGYLRQKNYWLGLVTGSVLKFAFLYGTCKLISNLFVNQQVATNIAQMMSWPQLVTALVGGVLAYGFLRGTKKLNRN
ncbi:MAG: iron hydrogenase [Dehalococcoidales bacterium]|nr:iron hydrogenase [Dehalococcoidales bacterium]